MKMPEPVTWIYQTPLYDKQALIDLLEAAINSYSPDDTAMDYINKLIDMKETL